MSERVKTVQLTMEIDTDVKALQKFGTIDAFQDWSPPGAAESTHIKSCFQVLRVGGRASLMGGSIGDISIPYAAIMFRSLEIRGKFMYSRDDVLSFIKMIQIGVIKPCKHRFLQKFPLERSLEAFKVAAEHPGHGSQILIEP
jgi:threonine dehydrogenase-like Zn-dependent dehydrogenase